MTINVPQAGVLKQQISRSQGDEAKKGEFSLIIKNPSLSQVWPKQSTECCLPASVH